MLFRSTNVVEPGFFPSKLANGLIEVMGGVEQLERYNPLGRLGEPEDIASVMIYICSKAGSYLVRECARSEDRELTRDTEWCEHSS